MVPEVKICVNLLKPQMKRDGISPHYEKYITGSENLRQPEHHCALYKLELRNPMCIWSGPLTSLANIIHALLPYNMTDVLNDLFCPTSLPVLC